MEFLTKLGFDPIMLLAQVLNFLIIFYLLKRFLYKPLLDMVKKRGDKIAQGLKDADEAKINLEKTLEEEKKILAKAQNSAKKIVEEAKLQAAALKSEIEAKSKFQTEKLLEETKVKIEEEAKETERRLTEKITVVASQLLAKSLKDILSEKERKEITQKALKEIKIPN